MLYYIILYYIILLEGRVLDEAVEEDEDVVLDLRANFSISKLLDDGMFHAPPKRRKKPRREAQK